MVKEISDKYVFKNDLTLLSAVERYIAFAPQIKNKKTGSIGLKSATVIRYEFLKKIYGEYKIKKEKNILIDCFKSVILMNLPVFFYMKKSMELAL